jgi:hypothetical protein
MHGPTRGTWDVAAIEQRSVTILADQLCLRNSLTEDDFVERQAWI